MPKQPLVLLLAAALLVPAVSAARPQAQKRTRTAQARELPAGDDDSVDADLDAMANGTFQDDEEEEAPRSRRVVGHEDPAPELNIEIDEDEAHEDPAPPVTADPDPSDVDVAKDPRKDAPAAATPECQQLPATPAPVAAGGEACQQVAPAAPAPVEEAGPFQFFTDLFQGVGDPTDNPNGYRIMPFATILGGGHYEIVHRRPDTPDDQREARFTTVGMSRMGFLAQLGKWVQLESEVELNAGPYGTSVWEGQAAIQVRNQLIRFNLENLLYADKLSVEAGRVTDPTSLNFFSFHTANLLLSDVQARTPILHAGFNRGNGIQVRYTLFDQLTVGGVINAGNPTSTSGTLQVGGTFPPFSRFYEVPQAQVGRDARGFPLSTFHTVLVSPSVHYEWRFIKAQASAQFIHANTNTNSEKDEPIMAVNLRGGAELQAFDDLFWDNRLAFFVNVSRIGNGVVNPDNLAVLRDGYYEGWTGTTGFDLDIWGKSGIGADVAIVRETEPGAAPAMQLFANIGGDFWFTNTTSVSARYAFQQRCMDFDCSIDGRSGFYVTLRTILGPSVKTRP